MDGVLGRGSRWSFSSACRRASRARRPRGKRSVLRPSSSAGCAAASGPGGGGGQPSWPQGQQPLVKFPSLSLCALFRHTPVNPPQRKVAAGDDASRSKTPAKRRGKKSSGEATAVTTAATLHSSPRAAGRALCSRLSSCLSSSILSCGMLNSSGTIGRPSRATVTCMVQHRFRLFGTTTGGKLSSDIPQKLPPSLRSGVSHQLLVVRIGRLQLPRGQCGSALHHDRGNILARTRAAQNFLPGNSPRANSVVPLAAGFTSLLFSVHPVHVEAVAGLVSRADIMAALAMILCLVAYVRAKQSGSPVLYVVSLMLALFASLSKETGATVVLLMLLLEGTPLRGGPEQKEAS